MKSWSIFPLLLLIQKSDLCFANILELAFCLTKGWESAFNSSKLSHSSSALVTWLWKKTKPRSVQCVALTGWERERGEERMLRSVQRLWVSYGHGVQHLVQELQSPVQVDLDPAWCLLNALSWVIGTPTFHKAHAQDAQPAQVIHTDASGCRQTWSRAWYAVMHASKLTWTISNIIMIGKECQCALCCFGISGEKISKNHIQNKCKIVKTGEERKQLFQIWISMTDITLETWNRCGKTPF